MHPISFTCRSLLKTQQDGESNIIGQYGAKDMAQMNPSVIVTQYNHYPNYESH